MRYSTRNSLLMPDATDIDFPGSMEDNVDIIDAALAKCNYIASADPTVNDDSGDGYSAGSRWHNTSGHKIFICEDATLGAAIWRQVYPLDISGIGANVDFGAYEVRALTFRSDIATGAGAPLTVASTAKVTNLNADQLDGLDDTAFLKHSLATSANDFVVASGSGAFVKKTLAETQTILDCIKHSLATAASDFLVASGSGAYVKKTLAETQAILETGIWKTMPGTPTRVSDSQFTITDTGNANLYDKAFPKGTVLKWEKSGGGFQTAMVKAAAYSSDAVTIDILGNDLAAGFSLMKYATIPAFMDVFIVPGKLPAAATTDIAKTIFWPEDRLVFSAIIRYKTAAATTKGVWDINDDATSIFTTKPEIAATATVGSDQISDSILDTALTVVAAGSAVTLDYDSGHATTPGSDAYVILYSMPYAWRYRA